MLSLTKRVDYALIALCHLANHPEQVASARDMAARYRLPTALLMNVLKLLSQAGIVESSRGPRGGYELARAADLISVNDLIEAIEGPVELVKCATVGPERAAACECELFGDCPVSTPVRRLHGKLKDFLKDITLADIAFDPAYGRPAALTGVGVRVRR